MRDALKQLLLLGSMVSSVQLYAGELDPAVVELAKQCAPGVSPVTMGYIVAWESGNNPLSINVNYGEKLPFIPTTKEETLKAISWLREKGLNFDIGLGQVNSSNFKGLGVTAEELLDGCNNLRAASVILRSCYERATSDVGDGQDALRMALSCYNTNSMSKGFKNGYVRNVVKQVSTTNDVPALLSDAEAGRESINDTANTAANTLPVKRAIAEGLPDAFASSDTDLFQSASSDAFKRDGPEKN